MRRRNGFCSKHSNAATAWASQLGATASMDDRGRAIPAASRCAMCAAGLSPHRCRACRARVCGKRCKRATVMQPTARVSASNIRPTAMRWAASSLRTRRHCCRSRSTAPARSRPSKYFAARRSSIALRCATKAPRRRTAFASPGAAPRRREISARRACAGTGRSRSRTGVSARPHPMRWTRPTKGSLKRGPSILHGVQ